jgi:putative tricarboxylic transport membrane protein
MFLSKEKIANSIVILCLAAFVLWYAIDTHNASSNIENVVLVIPVAAITLCLCLYEFFTQKDINDDIKEDKDDFVSVIPVIVLFTLYILTLEYLGFDVGTVLFLALFLFFHGEKRVAWIIGYSLVYGFIIAYFFSSMLPYPMPMLILPTDY